MELFSLVHWVCLFGWIALQSSWIKKPKRHLPKSISLKRPDGGKLTYYHWPSKGPSLLLIPGSWSEYRQFDAIRNYLKEHIDLVIVELPGHGNSWPPALKGSIENFANNVLQVTDTLKWKSWYVGGHSIGGMVAIELASKRPNEIKGVISIEGWSHHLVLNDAFAGQLYNTLTPVQEKQRLKDSARTLSRLTHKECSEFRKIWKQWNGEHILNNTPVRLLEVWGDRNKPRPSHKQMRIPNKDNIHLHWVTGASHSLPLEKAQEVAAVINQFVQIQPDH